MMVTVGVISDTHVPDRVQDLDGQVIDIFRQAGVSTILHAGDVSAPGVLAKLERVAPVYAVRGNRDWVALKHLPYHLHLAFGGVQIALTHGHGRWFNYLTNRIEYVLRGYRLEMFLPRLQAGFPFARVIVFGHTHRALNRWINGQLIFNPGSAHFPEEEGDLPSVGLLHFGNDRTVHGEIIWLD